MAYAKARATQVRLLSRAVSKEDLVLTLDSLSTKILALNAQVAKATSVSERKKLALESHSLGAELNLVRDAWQLALAEGR